MSDGGVSKISAQRNLRVAGWKWEVLMLGLHCISLTYINSQLDLINIWSGFGEVKLMVLKVCAPSTSWLNGYQCLIILPLPPPGCVI